MKRSVRSGLAVTVAANLPMRPAHADDPTAQPHAALQIVVIGGLITSAVLTLVVVPVVFSLIEGLRERVRRRRSPAMPLATIVGGSPSP